MRLQHEETDRHGRIGLRQQLVAAGEELFEGDEVAQRLAHLLSVDRNHVVVHPVLRRIVSQRGGRLRDLALVVREHQIHAAAVDVEPFAQILGAHGRALHVPAGEPVAPRRRPAHNVFGRRLFPQREVAAVAFVALPVQRARVGHDVFQIAPRKDAVAVVAVVLLHIEIDRSVRLVGVTRIENLLHEGLLLDDMPRSPRLDRGAEHAQRIHRPMVTLRVVVRHLHRFELFEPRLLRDLVLAVVGVVFQMPHVGDVAHVAHLVAERLQITEQQVEGHGRTRVPQMRIAVDRRPADVHAHTGRSQRHELLLAAGKRIV